jgi:hypothetical protein
MRLLRPTSCHDQGLLVYATPRLIRPTVESQMQLPSTGPLKLAIRWQRNRPKLQISASYKFVGFNHRAGGFGSKFATSEVAGLLPGYPPKCTFVRYLCGIQYRMEFVEPQVRDCKNRSRAASRSETLRSSGDSCSKTGTHSTPSSASSTFTVTIFALIADVGARLLAFPQGSAIWAPGRNVQAARSNNL